MFYWPWRKLNTPWPVSLKQKSDKSSFHRHGQSDTQTHSYTQCKGLQKKNKTKQETMQNMFKSFLTN